MMYFNSDALQKTTASYQNAIEDMLKITNRVEPGTNQHNAPLPTLWRPAIRNKALLKHTSRVSAGNNVLSIGKHNDATFFYVYAYWTAVFERFHYDWAQAAIAAYTDEDGYFHPERPSVPETLRSYKHELKLELYERTWSAREFVAKHDEVVALMDAANEQYRKQYLEAVAKADAEIARYNAHVAGLTQLR